jgi:glycosyltransferase involved in cell wall biosynthesis
MVKRQVRQLLRQTSFDVIHHMTFGTYLVPSRLGGLGVPFVFGPVGGGERTPNDLLEGLNWRGKCGEWFREVVREGLERVPGLGGLFTRAAWTFAATPATRDALARLGVTKMSLLPQSATGGDAVAAYASAHTVPPGSAGEGVRLVSASRLVAWKAVDLAIEALALARERGVEATLTVLQEGPQMAPLKALVERLGVGRFVEFKGRLPVSSDVFQAMTASDGLIHPAVHEAFGQACLEALALGVPVICLDWGGPGLIVDESCGFKVVPTSRAETVKGLADGIEALARNKAAGVSMAAAARRRASHEFQWVRMAELVDEIYVRVAESPLAATTGTPASPSAAASVAR